MLNVYLSDVNDCSEDYRDGATIPNLITVQ